MKGLLPAGELPRVSYSYMSREPEIEIEYEAVDAIYPSLYNTTDYILLVRATSEGGDRDVMIRAEVPGFTQVYEQKFSLGSQLTQFYIHPPVLTGELDLGSAKQAQIVFSVTDIDSGRPVIQDTLCLLYTSSLRSSDTSPILRPSSVSSLKRLHSSTQGSSLPLQSSRMVSSIFFGLRESQTISPSSLL